MRKQKTTIKPRTKQSLKYTGNKNPYAALAVNHNNKPLIVSTRKPK